MLNPSNIAVLILRGRSYRAQLVREYAVLEYGGVNGVKWCKAEVISQQIQALSYCLAITDYSSNMVQEVYNNLARCLGTNYASGVFTDPTVQPPGWNIIVINNQPVIENDVQLGKIPFGAIADTPFVVTNYQGLYAATYGNNPVLSVWVVNPDTGIGYTEDTGTVPSITFVGGVEANGIDTISIFYAGINRTGFIQILGIKRPS